MRKDTIGFLNKLNEAEKPIKRQNKRLNESLKEDENNYYEVTIGFAGFIGVENDYSVYANSKEQAVSDALEEAQMDLEVIAVDGEEYVYESEKPTKIKITKNNMKEIPVPKENIKATPSIEREMNNKKKSLKEDSYNEPFFQAIESALEDAGFDVRRFTDAGVMTKNIGWEISNSDGRVQLNCNGTWLDDEEDEEYNESAKPLKEDSSEYNVGDTVKVPYKYGSYTPGEYTEAPIIDIEDNEFVTVEIPSKLVVTMEQIKKWNNLEESAKSLKEALIPVSELPDMCYGVLPSDCSIIIIKKGETGYYLTNKGYEQEYADIDDWNEKNDKADEIADRLNDQLGVTPEQRMSMELRSMNGNWSD